MSRMLYPLWVMCTEVMVSPVKKERNLDRSVCLFIMAYNCFIVYKISRQWSLVCHQMVYIACVLRSVCYVLSISLFHTLSLYLCLKLTFSLSSTSLQMLMSYTSMVSNADFYHHLSQYSPLLHFQSCSFSLGGGASRSIYSLSVIIFISMIMRTMSAANLFHSFNLE